MLCVVRRFCIRGDTELVGGTTIIGSALTRRLPRAQWHYEFATWFDGGIISTPTKYFLRLLRIAEAGL